MTPTGKLYFLSKRSGTINVMKSDLDGSNATVVITGTGRESATGTVLVSTRDWKYLALLAKRDSDNAALYLINSSTDQMSLIDQGNVGFSVIGWYDHNFSYEVNRSNIPYGQANATSIKSYNADTAQITNIASTGGDGTTFEQFSDAGFLGDRLVYYDNKVEASGGVLALTGQQSVIRSVHPDGTGSTTVKSLDATHQSFTGLKIIKPNVFEYGVSDAWAAQKDTYYNEDASGNVTTVDSLPGITDNSVLPYYLQSPGEKQTFWYEPRDGKNTLFTGDENGDGGKQLASLSDFTPYGWFTDNYLLLSKNGSELYIAPADLSSAPLKITDYHKPAVTFNGYGSGYGGQ